MSKFYITNSKSLAQKVKCLIQKDSDFKISADFCFHDVYVYSTKKLLLDNNNSYFDNCGGAVSIGCPIYKNKINPELIYKEFAKVDDTRNIMCGQYACAVFKNDKLQIFGDPVGAFDIYYYINEKIYICSNDLYLMALCLSDKISLNEYNVLEFCLTFSVLNSETYFNEIKRLNGDKSILVDTKQSTFELLEHDVISYIDDSNFDKVVDDLSKIIVDKQKIVYHCLGDSNIFMTGGLDSRIPLAAQLNVGSKPSTLFGVGNTSIIYPEKADLEINKIIALKFDLKFQVLNWSHNPNFDSDWDKLIDKYGFHVCLYAGSKFVFQSLYQMSNRCCTMGYGGELYRNPEWIDNCNEPYIDVDYYIDHYYFKRNVISIEDFVGFRNHIKKKLEVICSKYNIDPNKIGLSQVAYLDLEYRKFADTRMLNLLNYFNFSYLLLFDKDAVNYAFVDYRYKGNGKMQLSLINTVFKEALSYPVFTHQSYRVFNSKMMTLELPSNCEYNVNWKSRIGKYIPNSLLVFRRKVLCKVKRNKKVIPNFVKIVDDILSNDKYYNFFAQPVRRGYNPYNTLKYCVLQKIISRFFDSKQ